MPPDIRVSILGGFRVVTRDTEVHVCNGTQRLLAFLALHSSWVNRTLVAGTLWPDSTDTRAYASLRSALSRMERPVRQAIQVNQARLRLADGIIVDVARCRELAQRIVTNAPLAERDMGPDAINELSSDVLCDWYDDWALLEMEDWRQLRLHALETLAERLTARGRFVDAARAALAAVKADALRESPHAALIRVHLAEGNRSEAMREFTRYERVLASELGIAPSPALRALVSAIERRRDVVTPR